MVITCSISSKELFTTWFVPHTTNICVAKEDGGAELDAYLSNGGYAPPEYIIKPDKSFVEDGEGGVSFSDAYIQSLGIEKHICNGTHTQFTVVSQNQSQPHVCDISKNSFTMNVFKNDIYSIVFYAANGQALSMISERSLTEGMNSITFENQGIAHGVYVVDIKYGNEKTRQKLLLK